MKAVVRRRATRKLATCLGILAACLVGVVPLGGNTAYAAAATGLVVEISNCAQPPTNVDHATFNDAQLKLYGLPARQPGEPLEEWQSVVRAAKHRVCTGTATNFRHVPPVRQIGTGSATYNEQLDIWAGNIAYGFGYTEVHQQWTQPCLTLRLDNGVALAWAGLGGDPNDGGGNLVQSGTVAQEYSNFPGHWTAQYYAFIEDFPSDPTVINKFSISCGDLMYAADWQDYSGGVPVRANMYIADETRNTYAQVSNTVSFSNGSTAEWIMERASGGGWGTNNLAKFGSVNYNHVEATRYGSYLNPINLPHNYSTMYYHQHSLVSAGALYQDCCDGGANFNMTWLYPN